jgi:hypothetical protein
MVEFNNAYKSAYAAKTAAKKAEVPTPQPAKKNFPLPSGKPRTVKQGDFTYTWNPETGAYE